MTSIPFMLRGNISIDATTSPNKSMSSLNGMTTANVNNARGDKQKQSQNRFRQAQSPVQHEVTSPKVTLSKDRLQNALVPGLSSFEKTVGLISNQFNFLIEQMELLSKNSRVIGATQSSQTLSSLQNLRNQLCRMVTKVGQAL